MKTHYSILHLFLLLALAVTLAGCIGKDNENKEGGGVGPTFKTPEEVFKAATEAGKKKDMGALLQCLTEESIEFMAARIAWQEMRDRAYQALLGERQKTKFKPRAEV